MQYEPLWTYYTDNKECTQSPNKQTLMLTEYVDVNVTKQKEDTKIGIQPWLIFFLFWVSRKEADQTNGK